MPVLDDRTDDMSTALAADADTLAAAIVQTAHARVCRRLETLITALNDAFVAFGCDAIDPDGVTFPANTKALAAVLFGSTPTVDLPNAWWSAEETAVRAALDDANRGYAVEAQAAPTDHLPAA